MNARHQSRSLPSGVRARQANQPSDPRARGGVWNDAPPRAAWRLRRRWLRSPVMDALETKVTPGSKDFQANRARMQALVDELRAHVNTARAGGGSKALARHREQNKLFVRDRIQKILDPSSPFLELGSLAAHGLYEGSAPC